MVPEIWRATDNFCHSRPFFALLPPPPPSPMDPENQNFGKMKKAPEDIIVLQMCTINDNHTICG